MNVTQRKYTLERLTALTSMKINALVEENDILVKANNDAYLITFKEAQFVILSNPEVVTLVKVNGSSLQADYKFDETTIRSLLNKPQHFLRTSSNGYVDDSVKHLQKELIVNGSRKVLISEIADRIVKLQHRAQYAKDLIMLGDAKEAMQALEEFNSLIF